MKQLLLLPLLFITVLSFGQVPNYVPTNGLVGYWPFNGNANDESGNGNDGTVTDATLTADQYGNANSAYNFDYTGYSNGQLDDMIYIAHNNSFNTPELTVSCWFKPTAWSYPGNPGTSCFFRRGENGYSTPIGSFWSFYFSDAGDLSFNILDDAANISSVYSGPAIQLNNWYHTVGTYDGQVLKLYLNGVLIDSLAGMNLLSIQGNSGVDFGVSFQANGYWRPFNGDIDDSGIWNRALSESEIQQLHASCTSPITLNNIPDQTSCVGGLVTLTANATVLPEDNLVIASVFDGPLTGGTPKGVELYVLKDINDLSAYGIGSANNGGGSNGEEFTFPAVTAAAGDYIYLASESTQFNNWFGFNADYVTGAVNINGDDAIELFYSGSVIDVFGDIDVDGNGEPWEYMDGWAYRNNSTGPDGGSFTLANWSFSGPNALDGELLNSTAASPIPNGTYTHAGNSAINTYTMDVSAAGSMDYIFAGDFSGTDPAININLGDTLVFNVSASGHPFWINNVQGTGNANGVAVANNGTSSSTITWIPTAAGTYYYNCEFHSMMTNTITVGAPAISYAWDNGVVNGVPFTPAASGEYIVIATGGVGCTATDTVNIIVNALPSVDAGTFLPICDGDTVTLSGAGATTYIWDNGISDGVLFTPSTTTLYTVTGTDANGCSASDTVSVGIWNLPLVDAGADQPVCDGNQATLSGSGAASYVWNNSVSDGVAFTPVSTATYTVIGTDGNGCKNSDQVEVSVNALPVVSAGPDVAVCAGDSAILNGSGAASYTWDNGIMDGVHFIPVAANTYTVTGTDGNGCANTDQVAVTLNVLPTVVAGVDQTVCAGDPVTVSGAGASSYTWDNGISDGVAFTANATATYTVIGADVNGCENTDDMLVTVTPSPNVVAVVAADTVCVNLENVTLSGSPAGGVFSGNGVTDDRFYPTVAGVGSHDVLYSYTDPTTGCLGTDSLTMVVEECTGITENGRSNLSIYPNPTSDQITLDIKGYSGVINVNVYDLQGRLLETTTNNVVSLRKHAKGIYVLKVSYGVVTEEIRVVKE